MATLAMQNDQGIVGVPTGLSDLDEKLGGLIQSNYISRKTFNGENCTGNKHGL